MGGVTTSGYPYVTPTDHPKEFPAHSQALANKLEADAVWVAYVPTVTGCTVQTLTAEYCKVGRTVTVSIKLTVGTMTGPVTITTPFPVDTVSTTAGVGTARMTPGNVYYGMVACTSTTFTVQAIGASGVGVALAAGVPGTWATGNAIVFVATYKTSTP